MFYNIIMYCIYYYCKTILLHNIVLQYVCNMGKYGEFDSFKYE